MTDGTELTAQAKVSKYRRFNILSFDGGGVRGVMQTVVTSRIVKNHPNFLRDTDLFAGTSTGAIQALGLAANYTPAQIRDMYTNLMGHVFADSILDDVKDVGCLFGADYNSDNLRGVLQEQFGDMRLGELEKKVLVPAFQLDSGPKSQRRSWKLKVFHNFPGNDSDSEEKVMDVALRSSAAPVFFPTYQGYIDGGVAATNPSMLSIAQALDTRSSTASLDQLHLLSLSTGSTGRWVEGQYHDWGVSQWAPHLLALTMEASLGSVDFQCRQLLGEKYFRFNPSLAEKIGLADWEKVPELVQIAKSENLDSLTAWLLQEWQ